MKRTLNESFLYLCPLDSKFEHKEESAGFILSRDAVIAQQDYICGKISAPTTIIQFCGDTSNKWERIDSEVSSITLRTSCDLLRRCIDNNGEFCRNCDTAHAGLFYNLSRNQIIKGELKTRVEGLKLKMKRKYNNPHYSPTQVEEYGHIFLSYNCPMFGYRELVFPIFFEKKVVAVFVVGQIKLTTKENEEAVRESKEIFFENHERIFDKYIDECRKNIKDEKEFEKYSREKIKNYIINESHRGTKTEYRVAYEMDPGLQIPSVADALSETGYKSMIETICKWLDNLETQLNAEMKLQRENIARDILENALARVHRYERNISSINPVKSLWDSVGRFADEVTKNCALEYMVIYGTQSQDRSISSLAPLASCVEDGSPNFNIPLSFSLDAPSMSDSKNTPIDSNSHKTLFNAFSPILKDCNRLIAVAQFAEGIPAASMAVLVKYRNEIFKDSMDKVLISRLKHLVVFVSSYLAAHFENEAQEKMEKIMRIYKHEMVNLTSDVSRIINEYLGNHYRLRAMNDVELDKVYQDAANTLKLFQFFSENIGILLDKLTPAKNNDILVYKDLLNKWARIKHADAIDKGCVFICKRSVAKILKDPRYSELVIYNIFTNAVKYSYKGTKIHVHCTPNDSMYSLTKCVISVTNFSFEIPEKERGKLFDMAYRMEKAIEHYPEGSGIGLWLAKEVMDHIGGKVRLCKPEKISEYNVPLLNAYVNNLALYPNITSVTLKEAKEEYNRLKSEYIHDRSGKRMNALALIVSDAKYDFKEREIEREIKTPTYAIKFEVEFNG